MNLNDRLSPRAKQLLFQTLELLRKELGSRFSDWKDADEWLFSELDFTKEELAQIYKDRGVLYHDASAVDLNAAELAGQRQKSIEQLLGRAVFSDEAQAVVDDLNVMLGVDALDINNTLGTDAERQDMVRYIERVIREYHLEREEQLLKDGCHDHPSFFAVPNAKSPSESLKPLSEQILLADKEKLSAALRVVGSEPSERDSSNEIR